MFWRLYLSFLVLIVLPVENIAPRYFEHYGAPGEVKSRVAVDA